MAERDEIDRIIETFLDKCAKKESLFDPPSMLRARLRAAGYEIVRATNMPAFAEPGSPEHDARRDALREKK